MDDISRGSAPGDPGQRVVEQGEDRIPSVRVARLRGGPGGDGFADAHGAELAFEEVAERPLPLDCAAGAGSSADRAPLPDRADIADAAAPESAADPADLGIPSMPELPPTEPPADPSDTDPGGTDPGGTDPSTAGADLPDDPSSEDGLDGEAGPPEADELPRVLCALLLSSREALSILRLADSTHTTPKQVAAALEQLRDQLRASELPLELSIAGEQVRLLTSPEVFGYLRNLRNVKKQEKLSAAALETLAVIAYRQPVIRAEIEAIRGVKAGPVIRTLLEHRMIKITGRADVPGRPLQYGTTQHFLETFGLQDLKDLPSVKEFRSL